MESCEERFLDLVVYPHSSLSRSGFVMIMTAVAVISFCVGFAFLLSGAWPVLGFLGVDVLLIYLAFRLNFRAARRHEVLRLTREEMEIVRVDPAGRAQRAVLENRWLRVECDERHLLVRADGKCFEIASFLGAEEKQSLASLLRQAIRRSTAADIALDAGR